MGFIAGLDWPIPSIETFLVHSIVANAASGINNQNSDNISLISIEIIS